MMKYRVNKRTGDLISEIGIGSSYMFGAGMDEAVRALRLAVEGGINYFDLAAGTEQHSRSTGKPCTMFGRISFFRSISEQIMQKEPMAGR